MKRTIVMLSISLCAGMGSSSFGMGNKKHFYSTALSWSKNLWSKSTIHYLKNNPLKSIGWGTLLCGSLGLGGYTISKPISNSLLSSSKLYTQSDPPTQGNWAWQKPPAPPVSVSHRLLAKNAVIHNVTMETLNEHITNLEENALKISPSPISAQLFAQQLQLFNDRQQTSLYNPERWQENKTAISTNGSYNPFIQKRTVPPGTKLIVFGDIHGNIHGLMRLLDKLVERKQLSSDFTLAPDVQLIFLGDYTDRGTCGVEVLYTLLKLKNSNPDCQVTLLRGNHEDIQVNDRYGFSDEVRKKFGSTDDAQELFYLLNQTYQLMPSAYFVGTPQEGKPTQFRQFCHGGIEFGVNPQQLLADHQKYFQSIVWLNRIEGINRLSKESLKKEVFARIPAKEIVSFASVSPMNPVHLGYSWNDVRMTNPKIKKLLKANRTHTIHDEDENDNQIIKFQKGRGWEIGEELTKEAFTQAQSPQASIVELWRAHQCHGPMEPALDEGKGLASHWGGAVHTTFAVPVNFTRFNHTNMTQLTTHPTKWQQEHIVVHTPC